MSKSKNQFLAIGGIKSVKNAFGLECRFNAAHKAMRDLLVRLDEVENVPHDVLAMVVSAQREAEKGTAMMHDLIVGIFDGSAFNHHETDLMDDAFRCVEDSEPASPWQHIKACEVAEHISPSEVAKHMDLLTIRQNIINDLDLSDLVEHLDLEDIARHIDASDVASNMDASDVAKELVYRDIVDEIDLDALGSHVAAHIDADDVAHHVSLRRLAEEIDLDTLAKRIDLAMLSAALLKALSIVPSVTLKVGETKPAFVND